MQEGRLAPWLGHGPIPGARRATGSLPCGHPLQAGSPLLAWPPHTSSVHSKRHLALESLKSQGRLVLNF